MQKPSKRFDYGGGKYHADERYPRGFVVYDDEEERLHNESGEHDEGEYVDQKPATGHAAKRRVPLTSVESREDDHDDDEYDDEDVGDDEDDSSDNEDEDDSSDDEDEGDEGDEEEMAKDDEEDDMFYQQLKEMARRGESQYARQLEDLETRAKAAEAKKSAASEPPSKRRK